MSKKELYVERREEGDYAIRRPGSERASYVCDTQAEAIDRARDIDPDAAIHVERVRYTNLSTPDKWRKPYLISSIREVGAKSRCSLNV